MKCLTLTLLVVSLPLSDAHAAVQPVKLPAETAVLKQSTLPGYTVAEQKCAICHSADYVNLQPPTMTLAQWNAEMVKMQHAYGAPIDDAEIKVLSIYLASAYGDASTVTAADAAGAQETGSSSTDQATPTRELDVNTLLAHNACLSCHAVQQKVMGPAYHDVSARYKGEPHATSSIEASIRAGGSGKWGAVQMPPFPNLSSDELHALADFVLRQ